MSKFRKNRRRTKKRGGADAAYKMQAVKEEGEEDEQVNDSVSNIEELESIVNSLEKVLNDRRREERSIGDHMGQDAAYYYTRRRQVAQEKLDDAKANLAAAKANLAAAKKNKGGSKRRNTRRRRNPKKKAKKTHKKKRKSRKKSRRRRR